MQTNCLAARIPRLLRLPLWFSLLPALAAQTPASDIASQVIANENQLDQRIDSFTFEFEARFRGYSAAGKLRSETVNSGETYQSPVTNVDVILKHDGKDVKPKDIEKQRKQAVARLQGVGGWSNGKVHMSVVDVLHYCSLSEPGTQEGSLVIAFDQCQSPFPLHAYFPHIRGTMRIDPQTHAMESWKAFIKDGPTAGAVLYEQATQLGPGMRVPAFFHINLAAAPHLFPKDNFEITYRLTHPQRFGVEANQNIQAPGR